MPLQPLADAIVFLNEKRGSTPVIVTPKHLSLRRGFFLELVRSLGTKTARPVRIDWYQPAPSLSELLDRQRSRWVVSRLNRSFESETDYPNRVCIQMTAAIGRPGGVHRDLVVGLIAEQHELPPWAAAIRLSGNPAVGQAKVAA